MRTSILAVLILTVGTIGRSYGWIPDFKVEQAKSEIYTNVEQVEFSQILQHPEGFEGDGVLRHVIATNDTVSIFLEGTFITQYESNGASASALSYDPLEYVWLEVEGNRYYTGFWSNSWYNYEYYEEIYQFDVPTEELYDGVVLTLSLGTSAEDSVIVSIQLTGAETIVDLQWIDASVQSEWIDLAVEAKQTEDGVEAQLYSIDRTGMDLVCYGIGRDYDMIEYAEHDMLRIESGNLISYASSKLGQASSAVPRTILFSGASTSDAVIYVPFIVFRQESDIQLECQFNSRQEALAYSETVEVPYGTLVFSIQETQKAMLRLCCQVHREDDQFRIIGLERVNSPFHDYRIQDRGDVETIGLSSGVRLVDETDLNDHYHFTFSVPGIVYALITDFSIPLSEKE